MTLCQKLRVLSIAALFGLPAAAGDRIASKPFATRSEVYAPHAMAATSHPLATQIALDVMKQGGSAVDAAIAANAALGLMEPTGNGVGGDLFAIVWDPKTKKLYGYNGSGRSPGKLTLEWFQAKGYQDIPSYGPLPVTVPGTVRAWSDLHARFGKQSLAQNLAPTIRYAREGHPVAETIAYYWSIAVPRLGQYPGFNEQFTVNGKAPVKGQVWKNPNLANTLQAIADGGADAFYKGPIAKTIADYIQGQGGFLSVEDLANHRGEWVEPISTTYRGVRVWELPPNGQGLAALQMLNILELIDFSKITFGSPEHIHAFVEAKKLAFADRAALYADPDFVKIPLTHLLSKEYARERARLIDPAKAMKTIDAGAKLQHGDTIYLTTADADGMMVSLIQSNYRGMGSGMAPPGLGFILQDRGEQFVLKPGHTNSFAPNKRPFHTIIPAFITKNDKPWISFGLMGGAMQPQGHVQIVMNLIDFGMNLQEAGDAPRIQHDGSTEPAGQNTPMSDGGTLNLESQLPYASVQALMRKGHRIEYADGPYGGYQAIARDPDTGMYIGATESRKDGQAAGY